MLRRVLASFIFLLVELNLVACTPNSARVSDAGVAVADAGPTASGADGGNVSLPTDAGVVGCSRQEAAKTADVALYDELLKDLSTLTGAQEKSDRIDSFVRAVETSGGTPLTSASGKRVVFFAKGRPVNSYSAAGSWNNWEKGVTRLEPVGDSDLYVADITLERNQAHAYKLVDGDHWFEDHRSQNATWDGINRNAVGQFNGVVFPGQQDASKGRLVAWRYFKSNELNDQRDVFIYIPAVYENEKCAVLPTLYFNDGNESLTREPFSKVADDFYAANSEQAALLVFVALPSQDVRMSQYAFGDNTTGDAYLRFLTKELVPAVTSKFRTCAKASDRGVSGASLGGLISTYAAFQYPEVFGYVGAQSPSLFWGEDAMLKRAAADPVLPIRFYLDSADVNDNADVTKRMAETLSSKNYEVKWLQETGARHDWFFWQRRLPGLLQYFREGKTGCARDQ